MLYILVEGFYITFYKYSPPTMI